VSAEEFKAHFEPYAATCDYPSCLFWKEQLAAFPEAVIVHSVRSPESWAASALDTIMNCNGDNPRQSWGIWLLQHLFPFKVGRPMRRMALAVLSPQFKGDYSPENLANAFKQWTSEVVKDCPPEKLLIFAARDGWEPLCKHLKMPVPNVPYPHVNDTREFKRILMAMGAIGWLTAAAYGYAIAKLGECVMLATQN